VRGRRSHEALELFGQWQEVRVGLLQALDMITNEKLSFAPRDGLWSLGTVARQIANAEHGWFRYVATDQLDEWPALDEDETPTVDAVKTLLTEVHSRTEAALSSIDISKVDRIVEAPRGARFPVQWIIWHVLVHEIHLRSEIYIAPGLMGLEALDL
jgi:uncharacterized damage-inducible protein DinB